MYIILYDCSVRMNCVLPFTILLVLLRFPPPHMWPTFAHMSDIQNILSSIRRTSKHIWENLKTTALYGILGCRNPRIPQFNHFHCSTVNSIRKYTNNLQASSPYTFWSKMGSRWFWATVFPFVSFHFPRNPRKTMFFGKVEQQKSFYPRISRKVASSSSVWWNPREIRRVVIILVQVLYLFPF